MVYHTYLNQRWIDMFSVIKPDKTENQMLYSKQLSNEKPPWNKEHSN